MPGMKGYVEIVAAAQFTESAIDIWGQIMWPRNEIPNPITYNIENGYFIMQPINTIRYKKYNFKIIG